MLGFGPLSGQPLSDTGAPGENIGTASGVSVASAESLATAVSTGSAAGTSTATAELYSLGIAVGSSAASGQGQALVNRTGTAASTATASGDGRSLALVTGSATGTSTATGLQQPTGFAYGSSLATAQGIRLKDYAPLVLDDGIVSELPAGSNIVGARQEVFQTDTPPVINYPAINFTSSGVAGLYIMQVNA